MKCPKCGMDGFITRSGYAVSGDQSANTPTKLYRILTFTCRNKQCEACGKEIGQERLEQPLEQTTDE